MSEMSRLYVSAVRNDNKLWSEIYLTIKTSKVRNPLPQNYVYEKLIKLG